MNSKESNMNLDIKSGRFLGKTTTKPNEEETLVRDPVCGMSLEQSNAVGRVKHKRTHYYFCSPGCEAAFLENHLKYLPGVEGHNENPKAEGPES